MYDHTIAELIEQLAIATRADQMEEHRSKPDDPRPAKPWTLRFNDYGIVGNRSARPMRAFGRHLRQGNTHIYRGQTLVGLVNPYETRLLGEDDTNVRLELLKALQHCRLLAVGA